MSALDPIKKKKGHKLYDLSELEAWLEKYEIWYNQVTAPHTEGDSGGQPDPPPPPPPGVGGNP